MSKYTWKEEEREGRERFTTEFHGGKRSYTEKEERKEEEIEEDLRNKFFLNSFLSLFLL